MDISLIENEMTNSGIDVKGAIRKRIYCIFVKFQTLGLPEASVKGYDKFVKGILVDLKQPSIFGWYQETALK